MNEKIEVTEKKERIYWIDNLRAFLIICVVFAHLIKTIYFPGSTFLYFFIFSFHMPAMIFLSGLCAKDKLDIKGLIKRIILPYIVFQIILFLVNYFIVGNDVRLSFILPDWIMWYMFSLATWTIIIPLFKTESKKLKIIFLALSVLAALLAGFVDNIAQYLSLSRTIVFFPFFLAGFYLREKKGDRKRPNMRVFIPAIVLAVLSICLIMISCNIIPEIWVHHRQSYSNSRYNLVIRSVILLISAIFVYLLSTITPNKKICYITYLGRNTITVYMLHGIIIRIFRRYQELFSFIDPLLLTVLLTVVIVLISANPPIERAWKFFFGKRPIKEKKDSIQIQIQS